MTVEEPSTRFVKVMDKLIPKPAITDKSIEKKEKLNLTRKLVD